jgi:hypothetical protein
MDEDHEGQVISTETQKAFGQNQVTRAADGQKLGKTLQYTQKKRVESRHATSLRA